MTQQENVSEPLAKVQQVIAQRKSNGEYLNGVEEELEAQFGKIAASLQSPERSTLRLAADVATLRSGLADITGTASVRSRNLPAAAVHALVRRLVRRHTNQLATTVHTLGESTAAALEEVLQVLKRSEGQNTSGDLLIEAFARALSRLENIHELGTAVRAIDERLARLELAISKQK